MVPTWKPPLVLVVVLAGGARHGRPRLLLDIVAHRYFSALLLLDAAAQAV
jgi:hypothetical protein